MAAAVPSAAGGAAAPVGDDTARLARKEKMDEFVLMVTTSSRVLQDRYKAENELLKSTEAAVRNSWTEVMRLAKVRRRSALEGLSAQRRSFPSVRRLATPVPLRDDASTAAGRDAMFVLPDGIPPGGSENVGLRFLDGGWSLHADLLDTYSTSPRRRAARRRGAISPLRTSPGRP